MLFPGNPYQVFRKINSRIIDILILEDFVQTASSASQIQNPFFFLNVRFQFFGFRTVFPPGLIKFIRYLVVSVFISR